MAVMSLKAGMGEYQATSITASLTAMDVFRDRSCFLDSGTAAQVPVFNTRASTRMVGLELPSFLTLDRNLYLDRTWCSDHLTMAPLDT